MIGTISKKEKIKREKFWRNQIEKIKKDKTLPGPHKKILIQMYKLGTNIK